MKEAKRKGNLSKRIRELSERQDFRNGRKQGRTETERTEFVKERTPAHKKPVGNRLAVGTKKEDQCYCEWGVKKLRPAARLEAGRRCMEGDSGGGDGLRFHLSSKQIKQPSPSGKSLARVRGARDTLIKKKCAKGKTEDQGQRRRRLHEKS